MQQFPGILIVSRAVLVVGALLAATPGGAQAQAQVQTQPPSPRVAPADVEFMQSMIGHHAQALGMSALVSGRTESPALRALAERIVVSQQDEITIMQAWLRKQQQPVPSTHDTNAHHAGHTDAQGGMPGMLSPAQMDSLRAAQDRTFDTLFLRYMIQHHEGALRMVATLLASPRGAHDPQVFQFAADVDADQRAEIRRMRALLEQLDQSAH